MEVIVNAVFRTHEVGSMPWNVLSRMLVPLLLRESIEARAEVIRVASLPPSIRAVVVTSIGPLEMMTRT